MACTNELTLTEANPGHLKRLMQQKVTNSILSITNMASECPLAEETSSNMLQIITENLKTQRPSQNGSCTRQSSRKEFFLSHGYRIVIATESKTYTTALQKEPNLRHSLR